MGAWGPGLYSDDYALDLKAVVAAVCRLPLEGAEIVELLGDLEPVSHSPDDEDYGTFWLVVADQLHKAGIVSEARDRAVAIIESGANLEMLAGLGMSEPDLRKRKGRLEELRRSLLAPPAGRRRKTLQRPQPLLMERGQVYLYPVDAAGKCVNPYLTDATRPVFVPQGWGACLVVGAGHALGYLAWYQLATARRSMKRKPGLDKAAAAIDRSRGGVGTLTRSHADRIQLELLGAIDVAGPEGPPPADAVRRAAADISIANLLAVRARPGIFR